MTDSPITQRSEGQSSQEVNVLHRHSVLGEAAEPLASAGSHSILTSLKINCMNVLYVSHKGMNTAPRNKS